MAGLTSTGLEILNLDTVLSDIVASEQDLIDENIQTRADELLGQLNNIIAVAISDQWELAQAVNDNFNPLKAEGKNLDDIGSITGIARNNSTPSTTTQQVFSTVIVPEVIASGTIVLSDANVAFITTDAVTVLATNTFSTKIDVTAIAAGQPYSIVINGEAAIPLTSTGDLAVDIPAWKALMVNASGGNYVPTNDATSITITQSLSTVTVTALVGATVNVYGAAAPAEAAINGTTIAAIGVVNRLRTAVTGLSTSNTEAYGGGSFVETDENYRVRILNNQGASNAATEPAITSAVSNIDGVSSVVMVQNRTDVPVGGLPAHSFELIVEGGDSQTIAQTIWDFQPAGIETHGSLAFNVLDSNGATQSVSFTRPIALNIAVRVTYAVYSEETQTTAVESVITPVVLTAINDLVGGVDVISSRLYPPIIAAITGYTLTVIETQTLVNAGDTPVGGNWSTDNIAVAPNQFASITTPDVTFVAL